MPGSGSLSRVPTRPARPDDLPAVLDLVQRHRAESHAEEVLSGRPPGASAAAGLRRLLADPGFSVVLAVLPGPAPTGGGPAGEQVAGLVVLGLDPLSVVLGRPQVTVDGLVVHADHRRRGVGAALLGAAAAHAERCGAAHVVAAAGQGAERQRFFARLGFAPLHTRRIVSRGTLVRALGARQRGDLLGFVARRAPARRRLPLRAAPVPGGARVRGA
ncbi:GNAT family N-acetyltransferase [Trujillonella humicola]|uniref:GNAT family N-acetyltransferase n=1 Tax=Trujillonella humicola TaxID=3383699 RepID=UPI00390678E9